MSWDVIIVGSGAAGSVIARRLVETTDARVLLIEAGGPDVHEAIHDPARSHELWHVEEDWDYFTVPQRGAAGRRLHLPRGRVLGGCTSTNGMIYIRGWHGDYDYWAYLGNAGWSYDEVLPLFKRGEDFDGGASLYRGTGGPLPVQSRYEPHPLSASFVEAALQYGIPHNPDHNGPRLDGVGLAQFTVSDGRRSSAAVAFLAPVLDSEGLEVRSGVTAQRLRFDGERCVGVEVEHHGEREVLFADAEVVVCAGAIESPKLLLLSGIGDPRRLHDVGVPLRVALPGSEPIFMITRSRRSSTPVTGHCLRPAPVPPRIRRTCSGGAAMATRLPICSRCCSTFRCIPMALPARRMRSRFSPATFDPRAGEPFA